MSAAHLAVDLGAESGRAMLARWDGERVELEELRRFPNRAVRLPDGLYWDALGLHAEVVAALGDVAALGHELRSVGVDSWAVDFGLLDERGRLLANPLSYRDGRGAAGIEIALGRVSAEKLYAATGIQQLPINTLFQLLAVDGLDRAETMLLIPDLLGYWLTGERQAEATNASTTQLLDARSGDWAWDLIDRLGLPRRLFPPVREPGGIVGGLLSHLAEATGLPRSTPVAAVASHDTASAVVGTPFEPGAAFLSSGTWSLVGVELDAPVLSAAAREANLTNERGFGGTTRLLKNVMGLWLLQECRRSWGGEYDELVALAERTRSGPLFDPDRPELLPPGDMPARIASLCGADPRDRATLVRAILDSLACKYRRVLDRLEEVTGRRIETLHVIGGGSLNAFLCRLTADVTGRRVLAGPAEAAVLGNALVQLHALGDLGSLDELRAVARRSVATTSYEPAVGGAGEELYGRFRAVTSEEVAA